MSMNIPVYNPYEQLWYLNVCDKTGQQCLLEKHGISTYQMLSNFYHICPINWAVLSTVIYSENYKLLEIILSRHENIVLVWNVYDNNH